MFFIVMHHFIVHAVFPDVLNVAQPLNYDTAISTITNGFLCVGVNCFILLSGYYGVHLRYKNIFNIFITCAIYGLLGYLVHLWYDDCAIGRSIINNSVLILSHSKWWYINCYIMLMLISPLLNAGLQKTDQRTHIIAIIGLTICQTYYGWYWGTMKYDSNGYSFIQFIYMYVIGAYLYRYNMVKREKRKAYLTIYIFCSLLCGGICCIAHLTDISAFWPGLFKYNNPIVILGSVSFFMLFHTLHFQSKFVNWLASGTLAAYLIQDQSYLGGIIYENVRQMTFELSWYYKYLIVLTISIAFLVIVMTADHLRLHLIRPILKRIKKFDEKHPILTE